MAFLKDESGATTVEWIVLTAAVIAIFGAVFAVISSGLFSSSENVSDDVELQTELIHIEEVQQKTLITADELQLAPVQPDDFESWSAANGWIDACIKTGGVPEVAADSGTNADGSPTKITCG